MANRKELVAAAEDLNAVVIAPDEAIDVKQSVAKIELGIREAAKIVQPDDKLKPATLAVLAELTGQDFGAPSEVEQEAIAETPAEPEDEGEGEGEDEDEEQPVAAAGEPVEPKKARGRPQPPLGKFEPVRRGASTYAKLLEAALAGPTPLADAVKAAGTDRDKAVSALKRARIVNGIDYSLDDADVLTIVLPKGVDAESVWHKAKASAAAGNGKAPREGTKKDMLRKLLATKGGVTHEEMKEKLGWPSGCLGTARLLASVEGKELVKTKHEGQPDRYMIPA